MFSPQDISVQNISFAKARLLPQIWTNYVEHMVNRKGDTKRYSLDATCKQIGWLARQMRKHNLPSFTRNICNRIGLNMIVVSVSTNTGLLFFQMRLLRDSLGFLRAHCSSHHISLWLSLCFFSWSLVSCLLQTAMKHCYGPRRRSGVRLLWLPCSVVVGLVAMLISILTNNGGRSITCKMDSVMELRLFCCTSC